jgi:hypothetical protein
MQGMFISPDYIVPNPANPQSFNRYGNCLNYLLKYVLVIITLVLFIESCSIKDCQYIKWDEEWTYATEYNGQLPKISFEYPGCFQPKTKEDYLENGPKPPDVIQEGIDFQYCLLVLQKLRER